jgi:hypothetical protein
MRSTSTLISQHAAPEQIAGLRHVYRLMDALCREHGVKLFIVNDGPPVVPAVCEELGITWFDLTERWSAYYASDEASQRWCFPTDPHFNELGHRLIAEGIHGELARWRRQAPAGAGAGTAHGTPVAGRPHGPVEEAR